MSTAVVTGARGVGYEVGRGLAHAGVKVIFGVRNPVVGDAAAQTIRNEDKDADVTTEVVDLADLKSVAELADACGTDTIKLRSWLTMPAS